MDTLARTPEQTAAQPVARWRGVLGGLLAAGSGLAAGSLLAELVDGWASPVLAIGDRVVDAVPQPVKQLAIDVFGTADKIALIVGIVVLLALAATGTGLLARTRPVVAAVVVAGFGGAGAVATVLGGDGLAAAVPSIVAGVVAVGVLLLLVRGTAPGHDADDRDGGGGRRSFLVAAGVTAAAGAAAGVGAGVLGSRRTARAAAARDATGLPAPAEPVTYDLDALTVDVDGVTPFETPNADFYRIDTELQVPQLSRDGWVLSCTGMVAQPLELTLDELEERYDVVERSITMTCVSNEVGGGLVGSARWRGVRLADVLEDAGVDPGADQLVGRSSDGWTAGFPVAAAFDRDALLAVGMNDEPLPAAHGFPLRLVVPGLYGYVSATKWLAELELTTFDAFDAYWVEREWDQRAPIRTQCRIDVPAPLGQVARGRAAIAGVAWAQTRGIQRVEVSIDDGEWQEAQLAEQFDDVTWRQWSLPWDTSGLEPGRHDIVARATDGTGEVQTEEQAPPFPSGATGWPRIVVLVEG